MMALNAEDREWVQLTAKELAGAAIEATLKGHIKGCPHGRRITWFKGVVLGLAVGLSIAAAGGLGKWVMAVISGGI